MNDTVVRARIESGIKNEAALVLADMGLTVSDAFRLMMRRIARDKALPFAPFEPGPTTVGALREAGLQRFDTVDELFADLNADD